MFTWEQRRIYDNMIIDSDTGCWVWQLSTFKSGYGQLKHKRKSRRAHRVSYEVFVGNIPEGACILHYCDEPSCVNPNHLWVGTQLDNVRDRDMKGRQAPQEGSSNGNAKLTEEDVLKIREMYATMLYSWRSIAKEFNISVVHVGDIVNRKQWTHI